MIYLMDGKMMGSVIMNWIGEQRKAMKYNGKPRRYIFCEF